VFPFRFCAPFASAKSICEFGLNAFPADKLADKAILQTNHFLSLVMMSPAWKPFK
jgi:hypothetical protein